MAMNLGDLFDHVDNEVNADFTLIYEEGVDGLIRTLSVAEFARSTNNLARQLLDRGCEPGDKVAIYMRNRAEYLVATVAALKARLTHVNINYRYKADELRYILENSDARCVLFDAEFAETLDGVRESLKTNPIFIEVADTGNASGWALPFQALTDSGDGGALSVERSPEDEFFIYTGGTTGLPKGVVWAQASLWNMIGRHPMTPTEPAPQSPAEIELPKDGAKHRNLLILPFMHGAGVYSAISAMGYGEAVVLMRTNRYEPELVLANIEKHGISLITIAGDAFAKPLVDVLDANPGKYDLSSLMGIRSSAMVFSPANKQKLLKHCPDLVIFDIVGSSESSAAAINVCNKLTDFDAGEGGIMQLTPEARVFDDDWREVEPEAGSTGFLAVAGPTPRGYYRDNEKTAQTMTEIDGVRYSRAGDWVEFQSDGRIKFLGRGNVCINTGGEKVYPEEVEVALKSHPGVEDCLIVGIADEQLGEAITAVVKAADSASRDEEVYRAHVRTQLAGYKTPRHVVFAPEIVRSAAGKPDYKYTREFAAAALGRPVGKE